MSDAASSSDVVVVGGGIIGAACAYELSRTGVSVVLCEREDLAVGASGRNPGFVWLHTRKPGTQLDLARFSRSRLEELPEELRADFGFRPNGGLIFVHTEDQLGVLKDFVEARRDDGVEVELLSGEEARGLAPILPERVAGASFCPEDAQITTAELVRALASGAELHGAKVLRGTEVRDIRTLGGRTVGVETSRGRIDAGSVVLAAGVWTRALASQLGLDLPIRPMRLQVVATEPLPPMLDRLLYGPRSIRQYDLFHQLPSYREELFVDDPSELDDELPFLELACQAADGRFLLGCPMDFPGDVWRPDLVGIGAICRYVAQAIPMLAGVGFDLAWAGLLPHMPDGLPVVDAAPDPTGVYVAAGHVFGNSSALATAAIVTALVRGESPPIDAMELALDRPTLRGTGTRW